MNVYAYGICTLAAPEGEGVVVLLDEHHLAIFQDQQHPLHAFYAEEWGNPGRGTPEQEPEGTAVRVRGPQLEVLADVQVGRR